MERVGLDNVLTADVDGKRHVIVKTCKTGSGKKLKNCHKRVIVTNGTDRWIVPRIGTKCEVLDGKAYETSGHLRASDIVRRGNKCVSLKQQALGRQGVWVQAYLKAAEIHKGRNSIFEKARALLESMKTSPGLSWNNAANEVFRATGTSVPVEAATELKSVLATLEVPVAPPSAVDSYQSAGGSTASIALTPSMKLLGLSRTPRPVTQLAMTSTTTMVEPAQITSSDTAAQRAFLTEVNNLRRAIEAAAVTTYLFTTEEYPVESALIESIIDKFNAQPRRKTPVKKILDDDTLLSRYSNVLVDPDMLNEWDRFVAYRAAVEAEVDRVVDVMHGEITRLSTLIEDTRKAIEKQVAVRYAIAKATGNPAITSAGLEELAARTGVTGLTLDALQAQLQAADTAAATLQAQFSDDEMSRDAIASLRATEAVLVRELDDYYAQQQRVADDKAQENEIRAAVVAEKLYATKYLLARSALNAGVSIVALDELSKTYDLYGVPIDTLQASEPQLEQELETLTPYVDEELLKRLKGDYDTYIAASEYYNLVLRFRELSKALIGMQYEEVTSKEPHIDSYKLYMLTQSTTLGGEDKDALTKELEAVKNALNKFDLNAASFFKDLLEVVQGEIEDWTSKLRTVEAGNAILVAVQRHMVTQYLLTASITGVRSPDMDASAEQYPDLWQVKDNVTALQALQVTTKEEADAALKLPLPKKKHEKVLEVANAMRRDVSEFAVDVYSNFVRSVLDQNKEAIFSAVEIHSAALYAAAAKEDLARTGTYTREPFFDTVLSKYGFDVQTPASQIDEADKNAEATVTPVYEQILPAEQILGDTLFESLIKQQLYYVNEVSSRFDVWELARKNSVLTPARIAEKPQQVVVASKAEVALPQGMAKKWLQESGEDFYNQLLKVKTAEYVNLAHQQWQAKGRYVPSKFFEKEVDAFGFPPIDSEWTNEQKKVVTDGSRGSVNLFIQKAFFDRERKELQEYDPDFVIRVDGTMAALENWIDQSDISTSAAKSAVKSMSPANENVRDWLMTSGSSFLDKYREYLTLDYVVRCQLNKSATGTYTPNPYFEALLDKYNIEDIDDPSSETSNSRLAEMLKSVTDDLEYVITNKSDIMKIDPDFWSEVDALRKEQAKTQVTKAEEPKSSAYEKLHPAFTGSEKRTQLRSASTAGRSNVSHGSRTKRRLVAEKKAAEIRSAAEKADEADYRRQKFVQKKQVTV